MAEASKVRSKASARVSDGLSQTFTVRISSKLKGAARGRGPAVGTLTGNACHNRDDL